MSAPTVYDPAADEDHGPERDPRQRLMLLANGQRFSAVVYALASLNVADRLAAGPRPADEVAAEVGADPAALYRLLRCAALLGVFTEVEPGVFGLTTLAEGLRTDVPDSARDAVLLDGSTFFLSAFASILHSATTGKPAFDQVHRASFWEYLTDRPEAGAVFDDAMTAMSRRLGELYLGRVDFSGYRAIADIGGGHGYFLSEILRRNPGVRGTLFDRPTVVAGVEADDRLRVVGGDFFADALPGDCDAYVLKTVLHDWPDDRAEAILRAVRTAIGDRDARLLVLEQVVAPGDTWDPAKFLDIDMLVVMGGRERNLAEWKALLARGGFALTSEPAGPGWAVLDCRPV